MTTELKEKIKLEAFDKFFEMLEGKGLAYGDSPQSYLDEEITEYEDFLVNRAFELGKSSQDSQQEIEPKGNIKPSTDTIQKEIEEIRKEFSELLRDINWETRRNCMPYDWNTYGLPHIVKLCGLLRVDLSDEHLLKQDKRGSWR